MSGPLVRLLLERIHRHGPLPFDAFLDAALYHPEHGFYAQGAGAGRRADFLTSPEVGPLFGLVIARALDTWWTDAGRPDPFVVVDAGAGRGTLARAVLDAAPACTPALRYVCVERSAVLRLAQEDLLPLEPAANALGPVAEGDDDDDDVWPLAGSGPIVTSLDELPATTVDGVVFANELLDNLPFRLLERTPAGWSEVRVGATAPGEDAALVEVLVEVPDALASEADRLAPDAAPGSRIPLQQAAIAWLRQAIGTVRRGRVVVVDYASTTPALSGRPCPEWARTYRAHDRGGSLLEAVGEQDVTCDVAVDQLARVRPPDSDTAQAEFLRAHGIAGVVDDARTGWRERAHIGDLAALRARSRVGEAEALLDPSGLGAFRVLEWVIPPARPAPRRTTGR